MAKNKSNLKSQKTQIATVDLSRIQKQSENLKEGIAMPETRVIMRTRTNPTSSQTPKRKKKKQSLLRNHPNHQRWISQQRISKTQ